MNIILQDFRLVHYAGNVTYNIKGFLDKNNDLLFRDLREVMSTTKNSITKVLKNGQLGIIQDLFLK